MSHAVRTTRIAWYLCLLVAPLLAAYLVVQVTAAVRVRAMAQRDVEALVQTLQAQLPGLQAPLSDPAYARMLRGMNSQAERQQLLAQWNAQATMIQGFLATPPAIDIGYARAIIEAVFMPLQQTSGGTVTTTLYTVPYVAPIDLYQSLERDVAITQLYMGRAFPGSIGAQHPLISAISFDQPVAWIAVGFILFPVTFFLLPRTRRRAKVRWSHIWRVFGYSLFAPILMVYVSAAVVIASLLFGGQSNFGERMFVPLCLAGATMGGCFWSAAVRRYLHMPRAEFVVIMLGLLTLLLILAAWFVMGEYLGWYEIRWGRWRWRWLL